MQDIEWDGRQITKPGLYSRVPLDFYHSQEICDGPSVSSSGLRVAFSKSLAHFYSKWSGNPHRKEEDEEEKEQFILGRAVHHLFLGEPNFGLLFVEQPPEYPDAKTGELKKWTYAANFCKDWRDQQHSAGRKILTGRMVENIKGMAASLARVPMVRDKKIGILNGAIERSMFWRDEKTGLWLKVRPDNVPTDGADYVDIKSTRSVIWQDLQKTIAEYGYHAQGALVRRAAREVLGINDITFTLIFIEKEDPWCVEIVQIKPHELDRGEHQNEMAINAIAHCLETNDWPGPGGNREDARWIELPEWAQKQIDERLQFGIVA